MKEIPEQIISKALMIFEDYFSLIVPANIVVELFKNNDELYEEGIAGCLTDTYVRDILIDSLMEYIHLPRWPMYGDSLNYKQQFSDSFCKQCEVYGIKYD